MFGYSTAFDQGYLLSIHGRTFGELNKTARVSNYLSVYVNNLYIVLFVTFFFLFTKDPVFTHLLITCNMFAYFYCLISQIFIEVNEAYILLSYHTD